MEFFIAFVLVVALLSPLYMLYRRHAQGKSVRFGLIANIVSFFAFVLLFTGLGITGTALASELPPNTVADLAASSQLGMGMIAAALATGLSGIGGGIAVAAAASAALGAISENEKAFGKALIFVALAEGIALYGLIISFMILNKF